MYHKDEGALNARCGQLSPTDEVALANGVWWNGERPGASAVLDVGAWTNLAALADSGGPQSEKSARYLNDAVRKVTVTARNQVLSQFKCPNYPNDHQ